MYRKYLAFFLSSALISLFFCNCTSIKSTDADIDYAREISNTIMHKWPDSLSRLDGKSAGWSYDIGLYLEAISNVYARTGEQHYYDYIVKQMDRFILPNDSIRYYTQDSYNIDKENYPEASASSMFVYTMMKAVRLGYISAKYGAIAEKGYNGMIKEFIVKGDDGYYHLNGTVMVSGLGGTPYRDGSFAYYMSEPVIQDDPKGMGAFILAANEAQLRKDKNVAFSE